MNARDELVERLALKQREKLGGMSDEAFFELSLSVRAQPEDYIADDEDRAFERFCQVLDAFAEKRADEELLDDSDFERVRLAHLMELERSCAAIAAACPSCFDARLVQAIAANPNPDRLLESLESLRKETAALVHGQADAADDVFARPHLRVLAAIARTCVESARFKMALSVCDELMALSPRDEFGARYTAALCYARLEDEQGFNELDRRFSRVGNAWFNLGRAILMYKLGRMSAASRALRGYVHLNEGGAYVLERPYFVDVYVPDRPRFSPGSLDETVLAVHEAEPVIADVPDFVNWALSHEWFVEASERFRGPEGML